jgi:anti-anti-sigma factor
MNPQYKIFSPSGIVDEQAAKTLHKEIQDAGCQHALIDMHQITFMNSSAVGIFVLILKEMRNRGGEMYLCSLSDQVQVMLELSRMHLVFRCFKNVQEFEAKIVGRVS